MGIKMTGQPYKYGNGFHSGGVPGSGPLQTSGMILGRRIHSSWYEDSILYLLDKSLYGTESDRVMELTEELADLLYEPVTRESGLRVRMIAFHFADHSYDVSPRSEMPDDRDKFFKDVLNSQRNARGGRDGRDDTDDELAEMPPLVLVFHGGLANEMHFPLKEDADVPEFFCAWDRRDTLTNGEVRHFDPKVARVSALGEIPNSYFADGYAGDIAWYRDANQADDTGKLIYSCTQVMVKSAAELQRPAGAIAEKDIELGPVRKVKVKGKFVPNPGSDSGSYWISDEEWQNAIIYRAHGGLFRERSHTLNRWVRENGAQSVSFDMNSMNLDAVIRVMGIGDEKERGKEERGEEGEGKIW